MSYGSPDSRRAEEFDSFRRSLLMRSKTVGGERREQWLERLKSLVAALFPDAEANVRKPGLATRMFSIEVPLPGRDKMHLLDLAQELDDNWKAMVKGEVAGGASCVYLDRLDAIWEWALDLGDSFVTGHVKLRNFAFERKPAAGERWERSERGDRPPYGRKPGPKRPYPDVAEGRPYQRREGPGGGGRPSRPWTKGGPPKGRPYRKPD